MRYFVRLYFHKKTKGEWFWQFVVFPSLSITRNKQNFIETGLYADQWTVQINFLLWAFGIKIEQDY